MEPADATPAPASSAPRRRRRLGRWLAALGVSLVVVLAVLAGLLVVGLRSEGGAAWLLARLPGLQEVTGVRGSFRGGPFEAARLVYRHNGFEVEIDGLTWRDLRWRWRPRDGALVGLQLVEPQARRVGLRLPPSDPAAPPLQVPKDLILPLEIEVLALRVDVLQIDELAPLRDLQAGLHLGGDGGRQHRVDGLRFEWGRLQAHADATLDTRAPFALNGGAAFNSLSGALLPWGAGVQVRGTLPRIELQGLLRSGAEGGPALDLDTVVQPFAAWPLQALNAHTRNLDLAALAPGLPHTLLDGDAQLRSSGLDRLAEAGLTLRNRQPGPWDRERLPVESLELTLASRPDQTDTLELQRFLLQLGSGRIEGSGHWERDTLQLAAELRELQAAQLDSRLAPLRLAGPLRLKLSGLPAPDASHAPGPQQQAELQLDLTAAFPPVRGTPPPPATLQLQLGAQRDASGASAEVQRFQLRAGEASAELSARLQRQAGRWQLRSEGEFAGFDPAPWWAGADPALWAPGRNRLNARWQAELALPGDSPANWIERWHRVQGQASLALRDSQLAGVPLQLEASAQGGDRLAWRAKLNAADNQLTADGQTGVRAADERWRAQLDAPALGALAPLAALHPALAPLRSLQGAVNGQGAASGRWPGLRSEGTLQATALRCADWQAERATLAWQFGGDADAPLRLSLDGGGLARGVQRVDTLRLLLDGSWRSHQLTVDASSPVRPPAWTDALLPGSASGSTLQLRADGTWSPEQRTWQGRLQELLAQPRGEGGTPWAAARGLAAQLRFGADGALQQVLADAGRVELLGAVLRWQQSSWQAAAPGGAPRITLDAELEPLAVVPWLQRLQPDFGWGGDLSVGGHFVVRSGADFAADLVIERRSGDLSLTQIGGTEALGLTDLRLALQAQDGVWHFTQAAAGVNLGALAGAQSLRVSPQVAWPPPDTPLEGVLEWRIANLGVWSPWVPPGWRLGGTLHTSAALGGHFGAPEYIGQVVGSELSVRSLLDGVDVHDGELAITLRGEDAKIERFVARAGDGQLSLEGGASFGATPSAQLRLQAERFRLLGRFDRRIVVSGRADMLLQRDQLKLDGRFDVDEGLIDFSRADAPTLAKDVVVRRPSDRPAPSAPAGGGPAATGPLRNAQVELEVGLGEALRIRGHGLDALLRGRLALTTPGGRPSLNGTVRTESGHYAAYGQKLDIDRGVLVFSGAVENPRLDIVAVRPNLDVQVGVMVSGTATNPRIRLFSEPEMSDMDKLSWLLMGRAPDGLGTTDTALLQRAALALLAGENSSSVTKLPLGLDELSVRQDEVGDTKETVVTLGKQVSQRWFVGYERGVNATTGTWQLIYRLAQRFTIRTQTGDDNSVDLIWTWRWD